MRKLVIGIIAIIAAVFGIVYLLRRQPKLTARVLPVDDEITRDAFENEGEPIISDEEIDEIVFGDEGHDSEDAPANFQEGESLEKQDEPDIGADDVRARLKKLLLEFLDEEESAGDNNGGLKTLLKNIDSKKLNELKEVTREIAGDRSLRSDPELRDTVFKLAEYFASRVIKSPNVERLRKELREYASS